jgi:SAM-dependent methyltransferase
LKQIDNKTLLSYLRRWLKTQGHAHKLHPPLGRVHLGDLQRLTPISKDFGFDRGLPIDRYYIENFLAKHSKDIRGGVLEIGDNSYTRKFGGAQVTKSDVLHVHDGNPNTTIIADLTNAHHIPSDTFDCFILTQTLQFIFDLRAALSTTYRILKPGGVVLTTVPGISQISLDEWKDSWFWSFTALSVQKLYEEFFPSENVEVKTFGNVLAATAFLQGLATQELKKEELDFHDQSYQLLITIRAVKPEAT